MTTIRYLLQSVGLWLAHLGGYVEPVCARSHLDCAHLDLARRVISEIERQRFRTGEQKRHNALTAMLNHGISERDAALAIELAVRETDVPQRS